MVVEDRAARQIKKLPKHVQRQVMPKLEGLASNPRPPGCQKLEGVGDLYRIRSGDHRIVYHVRDDVLVVLVVSVGDRGQVYERLRRSGRL